jgi:hypothetical protein
METERLDGPRNLDRLPNPDLEEMVANNNGSIVEIIKIKAF